MNFGVPSQRASKKAEKYPNVAVLTLAVDGGKGTSKAMLLNPKSIEILGLPEEGAVVAFGFDVDEDGTCTATYIMNANQEGIPDAIKMRVTKGNPRKVSEKKTYEYLSNKSFNLDNSVENEFDLEAIEGQEGIKSFKLVLKAEDTTETVETVETVENTNVEDQNVTNMEVNGAETIQATQQEFQAEDAAQAFAGNNIENSAE